MKKKTSSQSMQEIRGFLIALLVVALAGGLVYFLTGKFVTKEFEDKDEETKEVAFDYNSTMIGSMFKKPYDEYYVAIYDTSKDEALSLAGILGSYENKEDGTKVYLADLALDVNKTYYSETSNPKAKSIGDIKVGDFTLIKFKNGKIVKYIEGVDNISSELK